MFRTSVASLSERTSCDRLPVHPAAIVGEDTAATGAALNNLLHKSTLLTVRANVPQSLVLLLESFHTNTCVRTQVLLAYTPNPSIWSSTHFQFSVLIWTVLSFLSRLFVPMRLTSVESGSQMLWKPTVVFKTGDFLLGEKFRNGTHKTWNYQITPCCCPCKPHLLTFGCSWERGTPHDFFSSGIASKINWVLLLYFSISEVNTDFQKWVWVSRRNLFAQLILKRQDFDSSPCRHLARPPFTLVNIWA